jgi:hypothetical protein
MSGFTGWPLPTRADPGTSSIVTPGAAAVKVGCAFLPLASLGDGAVARRLVTLRSRGQRKVVTAGWGYLAACNTIQQTAAQSSPSLPTCPVHEASASLRRPGDAGFVNCVQQGTGSSRGLRRSPLRWLMYWCPSQPFHSTGADSSRVRGPLLLAGFGHTSSWCSGDPRVMRCAPSNWCAPASGSPRVAAFGRVRVDHHNRAASPRRGHARRLNPRGTLTRGSLSAPSFRSWRIEWRLTPAALDGNNTDHQGDQK